MECVCCAAVDAFATQKCGDVRHICQYYVVLSGIAANEKSPTTPHSPYQPSRIGQQRKVKIKPKLVFSYPNRNYFQYFLIKALLGRHACGHAYTTIHHLHTFPLGMTAWVWALRIRIKQYANIGYYAANTCWACAGARAHCELVFNKMKSIKCE